jgi:glycosyltransferase involved in cell wall biosynthesis
MKIDILIPAYDKPELLDRALASVASQSHRPLRVVVNDDNSPTPLTAVAIKYSQPVYGIEIEYRRNPVNLGPYLNLIDLINNVKNDFFVILAHDDYFVDNTFLARAVDALNKSDAAIFMANSALEATLQSVMSIHFGQILPIDGNTLISGPLWQSLHPAYSGIVFSKEKVLWFDPNDLYTSYIDENICKAENVVPDEGFHLITLGARNNLVLVTGSVVSIRGVPPDSYSRSHFWLKNLNRHLFLTYFNLYCFSIKHNLSDIANVALHLLVLKHPIGEIDLPLASCTRHPQLAIEIMKRFKKE